MSNTEAGDDAAIFSDAVQRILTDTVTALAIENAAQRKFPTALFDALAQSGVTSMLVPEHQGGTGAGISAAVAVMRAIGAAAAPGPIVETIIANVFLAKARLPAFERPIALAFAAETESLRGSANSSPLTLRDVLWGGLVDHVLIVFRDGNARIALTHRDDWIVTPGGDAADEPRDVLVSRNVPLACAEIPDGTYDELFCFAALLRSGQILGAIEWVFRRTVEFAMERKQFGREIGKFQAVQQMLAELADHALASAAITEAAALETSDVLIAAARSRLADAADAAIRIGHQVHGAIGFSREYALNFRTRRLMAWRDDYGSVPYWNQRLGERFIGLPREAVWPAITDTKAEPIVG
ncbi:MAG: hypothetical protein JWO52_7507 [Gammaproteobacteria bacterium]|nr:hypothetical protein [Gammaproteobacteria bacterium]